MNPLEVLRKPLTDLTTLYKPCMRGKRQMPNNTTHLITGWSVTILFHMRVQPK